ncbi:hypothetical protein WMY93_032529 [Mugilogobius chulae]|uniref:Uncharacterized protein n=1 Tax=Mugilogobius chulae TaxID=88201 RepID=A0AAW0MNV1_9GOBI
MRHKIKRNLRTPNDRPRCYFSLNPSTRTDPLTAVSGQVMSSMEISDPSAFRTFFDSKRTTEMRALYICCVPVARLRTTSVMGLPLLLCAHNHPPLLVNL